MSIFSPNIILSEKEELELYLGKKMSKNEYNNFSSNITSLSETIGKNPKLFKSFISGLISETETGKVNSGSKRGSISGSTVPPSPSRKSPSASVAPFALAKASSSVAPFALARESSNQPAKLPNSSFLDSIRNSSPARLKKINSPVEPSASIASSSSSSVAPSVLARGSLPSDLFKSIRESSPDRLKALKPKQAPVQSSNNSNIFNSDPKQKSMLTAAQKLANRNKAMYGNDPNKDPDKDPDYDNEFVKKYYTQTADMEQKYLKYKNKYLLLKQELGV